MLIIAFTLFQWETKMSFLNDGIILWVKMANDTGILVYEHFMSQYHLDNEINENPYFLVDRYRIQDKAAFRGKVDVLVFSRGTNLRILFLEEFGNGIEKMNIIYRYYNSFDWGVQILESHAAPEAEQLSINDYFNIFLGDCFLEETLQCPVLLIEQFQTAQRKEKTDVFVFSDCNELRWVISQDRNEKGTKILRLFTHGYIWSESQESYFLYDVDFLEKSIQFAKCLETKFDK